jgi:hypothetical protein
MALASRVRRSYRVRSGSGLPSGCRSLGRAAGLCLLSVLRMIPTTSRDMQGARRCGAPIADPFFLRSELSAALFSLGSEVAGRLGDRAIASVPVRPSSSAQPAQHDRVACARQGEDRDVMCVPHGPGSTGSSSRTSLSGSSGSSSVAARLTAPTVAGRTWLITVGHCDVARCRECSRGGQVAVRLSV